MLKSKQSVPSPRPRKTKPRAVDSVSRTTAARVGRKPVTAREILTKAGLNRKYWGRRIIAIEKASGTIPREDFRAANSWVTCACGKQGPRIPRHPDNYRHFDGEPKDCSLIRLGSLFGSLFRQSELNCTAAAKTLVAIEKRAAIVLRQTLKKKGGR